MIPVVTVNQMRSLDDAAIGRNLTTGYSYMLKAGTGLFEAVRELVPDASVGEIAVVCGKGNNGGDGYVAARLLLEAGYRVMCFSLYPADELKGEARLAYTEYSNVKGSFLVLDDAGDLDNLSRYRLIVDAILGTGAQGDPHGLCAAVIEAINESQLPVVAADTPSGLDSDSGLPGKPCIRATATVTMGFPKIGHFFYPGRSLAGRMAVQELGYPDELTSDAKVAVFYPEQRDLATCLPKRKPAGSKFDHGLAMLVAGSRGLTGSAALASRAALRTGCGMTHLFAPQSAIPVLAVKLTETVLHPLAETANGAASHAALEGILEKAASMQAICIGPGMSHEEETSALVRELVSRVKIPAILDADGLNAFKGRSGELSGHGGDLIITPHAGEWQRLFGDLPPLPVKMVEVLRDKAVRFRMTILLKGNPSLAASPDGNVYLLPFGNSALAKAGSGDVLSGIIVSLLAQGAKPIHAAILGAYLLGETGTALSRKLGEWSVIPGDVIEKLHLTIKKLAGEKG